MESEKVGVSWYTLVGGTVVYVHVLKRYILFSSFDACSRVIQFTSCARPGGDLGSTGTQREAILITSL